MNFDNLETSLLAAELKQEYYNMDRRTQQNYVTYLIDEMTTGFDDEFSPIVDKIIMTLNSAQNRGDIGSNEPHRGDIGSNEPHRGDIEEEIEKYVNMFGVENVKLVLEVMIDAIHK
jgi:hypothetical protein